MKKPPSPVAVHAGKIELLRTNSGKLGWRDLYPSRFTLSTTTARSKWTTAASTKPSRCRVQAKAC